MGVFFIILIFIAIWISAGAAIAGTVPPAESADADKAGKCAVCIRLREYWNGLDAFGKVLGAGWFAYQSLRCSTMGC